MTNIYFRTLIIGLFLSIPLKTLSQSSDNYLLNGDFEEGHSEQWGTWYNGVSDEEAYSGTYCGYIFSDTQGSLSQSIELKSNSKYTITFWAKAKRASDQVRVIMKVNGNSVINKIITMTTSYQQYTETFSTDDVEEISQLSFYKFVDVDKEIYIDEVTLVETEETLPQVRTVAIQNISQPLVGLEYQLQHIIIPGWEDPGTISWEVSNENAEVDPTGLLTTLDAGDVTVTTSYSNFPTLKSTIDLSIKGYESHIYYVDASNGNDTADGITKETAWKSLDKVNSRSFVPGDKILFKAGEIWEGQLEITTTRGTEDHPILFSRYGEGDKPKINGWGNKDYTVLLENAAYTEVSHFEITNMGNSPGNQRYGVVILANNQGEIYGTKVRHLAIHDVNGQYRKALGHGGGILYYMIGENRSRLVNAVIERNHIYDVVRNGIYGKTGYGRDYYTKNLLVKNNLIERIPGDGIVAFGCEDAVIEHNNCRAFTDSLQYHNDGNNAAAGIWAFSSNNTIIQYNEVSGHKAHHDAQGYDSDFYCDGTVIQYNYSHDNAGGFILICSDGTKTNGGTANTNSIVRYNISVNDGFRTWGSKKNYGPAIHVAGPVEDVQIYNNTFYWHKKPETFENELIDFTTWGPGTPKRFDIINNIFYSEEPTKFIYGIGEDVVFDNNAYFGEMTVPNDKNAIVGDPQFKTTGASEVLDYILQEDSPLISKGKLVSNNGGQDFFQTFVSSIRQPNVGAYNGAGENPIYNGGIEEETEDDLPFDPDKEEETPVDPEEPTDPDPTDPENELPTAIHPEKGVSIILKPNYNVENTLTIGFGNTYQNVSINIYSITGEVLLSSFYENVQNNLQINVQGILPGMYVTEVVTNEGRVTKKFLKR
ncbi:carbohydrate binding domain-containing protein [Flammeovirga agarivorans]|uniref:T9SS type A sorting domain-containing protein n=1 Tax=Flammeovirga agarivorans TaxID=2726742 RepID=A0A7X8SPA5_9BACT|nr:carbohydrate binding domain-containing protein [Flammeovirga agarivorans]NLR93864.1 T9SS type A sorting domain-containing protein [Flammeovirga agarivorans]